MTSSARVLIMLGTKKGAFLCFSDRWRRDWQIDGPYFAGRPVYHVTCDGRSGTVFAAVSDDFWGPSLERSDDLGQSWQRAMDGLQYAPESGLSVQRLWHVEPGSAAQPQTVYLGVEPAGLFKSEDGGHSWSEVEGLNRHATRERWMPGAGGLCLHTILPDPSEPNRLYIAISAAGSFRSDDGGASWQPVNRGVRADFMPDPYPEIGQCVHKVVLHPGRPDTLFQQNHCGVYRSDDRGDSWRDIGKDRLPTDFGFAMATHPHDPDTIYTVPLQSGEVRMPVERRMAVWRSRDGGESWQPLSCGLPSGNSYLTTLREGLATDSLAAAGVYAGTTAGELFFSRDEGDNWQTLASHLPSILSVEAAVLN